MKKIIDNPTREEAIAFIVANGYPFNGYKKSTSETIVGAEMKPDSFSLMEEDGILWPIEYYTKIYVE